MFPPKTALRRTTSVVFAATTLGWSLAATASSPAVEVRRAYAFEIDDVSFTTDGLWLVARGADEVVHVWDVASGRRVATTGGHDRELKSHAFSAGIDWLARGRPDGSIELMNLKTSRAEHTLQGHRGAVRSVAFSPDGRLLASAGEDGTVRVWDVVAAEPVVTLAHGDRVNDVAFDAEGRWLASGGSDRVIRLWTAGRWDDPPRVLAGHDDEVAAVTFAPRVGQLASGSPDGTVRLWDPGRGRPLALLASMRHGDGWVVATPEGLYDGTPEASSRLGMVKTDDATIALDALHREMFRPGLLAAILAGSVPAPSRGLSDLRLDRPRLEIQRVETSEPGLAVRIEARQRGGGLRDLRLLRNGGLVQEWPGALLSGDRPMVRVAARVPAAPGVQRIVAYGFNLDGVRGEEVELLVGADEAPPRGTARVLAIGINRHTNAAFNLHRAAPDAHHVSKTLADRLKKTGAFEGVETKLLVNDQATREGILAEIDRLESVSRPADAVFLYFAGHGLALGDRFFLVSHDPGHAGSRAAAEADAIARKALSDEVLAGRLRRVAARWLVLILDTSDALPLARDHRPLPDAAASRGLDALARDAGAYVLAASQGYRAAGEISREGHGLLVHALIDEGLSGPRADRPPRNGMVELAEWLAWPELRVPQLQAQEIEDAQRRGEALAFVDGEESIREPRLRQTRRPRLFYPGNTDRSLPLVLWREQAPPSPAPPGGEAGRP